MDLAIDYLKKLQGEVHAMRRPETIYPTQDDLYLSYKTIHSQMWNVSGSERYDSMQF
jgi:hypothetical protein